MYQAASALAVTTPQPTAQQSPDVQILAAQVAAPETTKLPSETPPIAVDFEAVQKEGKRVRAWLYSQGTVLDYPVVAYRDNEFFLTHDYTGSRSSAGSLFFDSRNTEELSGDQLIVYGHHMKDRSMFGNLLEYQKQEYYDQHPTLYLLTEHQNYRIELFAGWFVESEAANFPVWFSSAQAKKQYVQTAMANSDFTPNSTLYYADKRVISLVTCAYSDYIENVKYQLLGWLIELES